jgi:hypothetical protein
VTSIGSLALNPQTASLAFEDGLNSVALPALTSNAFASRDAQIPDLAASSAELKQLQSLASPSANSLAPSAIPAPTLPTTQQQTQAQAAAQQPPLRLDYYADGDDAE